MRLNCVIVDVFLNRRGLWLLSKRNGSDGRQRLINGAFLVEAAGEEQGHLAKLSQGFLWRKQESLSRRSN